MEQAIHPLKAVRKERRLTVRELAEAVCCSPATISRVEGRTQRPSHALVDRIVAWSKGALQPNDFHIPPAAGAGASGTAGHAA